MVDISSLKENDIIVRKNEQVTITQLEHLESGLVRINGGEENGGFDLISNDGTVYYETGMSDVKSYYILGKATLPVADEFEYVDESDLDLGAKQYFAEDFVNQTDIDYHFVPHNTTIVIQNGAVTKLSKVYMP
jgi:hypothetical protein